MDNTIIYPELSYSLMGILYRIHRKLGNTYQEKYYQRAIEIELKNNKMQYSKEHLIRLNYEDEGIGKYFLDFIIDNKIALEVKTFPVITNEFQHQVLAYLNSAKLKLGIIANFRTPRLTYRRLVNPRVTI